MSDPCWDLLEGETLKTEALENRVKELEALVASLREQLKQARATITSSQKRATRSWHDEYDHVGYHEDDRDR